MTGLLEARIPDDLRGQRLDQTLPQLFPDFSRTRLRAWIDAGRVQVDGATPKPRDVVRGGEIVRVEPIEEPQVAVAPESIALDVVHEDESLLVIAKPAGLVVHPGAGNPRSTLQNALLARDPALVNLPRAGIVHRLDKETSGLLVVARTAAAHLKLTRALAGHEVEREYEAVVVGVMTAGGTVDAPIDRHPVDRLKMAVRASGREAQTHYRVAERFRAQTHVRVRLETGRTHQIRVHMAHIGYPLVGDPVYGRRLVLPRGATPELVDLLKGFRRQALHAAKLSFVHPKTGKPVAFSAPLPADFETLLAALRADVKAASTVDPRHRA
jgi:23S rRNA pseudouridine1911/1915/1917 synthase